jgi:hypothetical protein
MGEVVLNGGGKFSLINSKKKSRRNSYSSFLNATCLGYPNMNPTPPGVKTRLGYPINKFKEKVEKKFLQLFFECDLLGLPKHEPNPPRRKNPPGLPKHEPNPPGRKNPPGLPKHEPNPPGRKNPPGLPKHEPNPPRRKNPPGLPKRPQARHGGRLSYPDSQSGLPLKNDARMSKIHAS